jgi:hypothetical protein
MKTYSLGDTIVVTLDLRDTSGVARVSAVFNEVQSGRAIQLDSDGGGQPQATIVLMKPVTDDIVPGEYKCQYVQAYDTRGNDKTHTPDIRFRIENVPGDHEGPELVSWS